MTTPMTVEQIAACRAFVDRLDPLPPDPWSEAIRERALRRARRDRLAARAALSTPPDTDPDKITDTEERP